MNDVPAPSPRISGLWTASVVWFWGCMILGWGCFVVAGHQLQRWEDRLLAAIVWQLCFAVGLGVILGGIVHTLHSRGETLRAIGWGLPTSKVALSGGILLGLLYTMGVYAGILQDPVMKGVNPLAWHWTRLALLPIGIAMAFAEEAMMRGYFMNELDRARVPVWAQIVLSGVCSGIYHAFHNWGWLGLMPGVILFTIHAALFVFARRSLLPSVVAHSLYHVLNAPYLLMYAMAQMQ